MKRAAALLLVVVGVAAIAAVAIRSMRDRGHHAATAPKPNAQQPYRLTCATEVGDVCRSLASKSLVVTVEAPGVTADRLATLAAGTDPGFDGWVAAAPWADIVKSGRNSAGLAPVTGAPLSVGATRVALALWRDRGIALRGACGGTLTWKCVGEAAGRHSWAANTGDAAWGDVKIALADPGIDSGGLESLGAATAGFAGSTAFVLANLQQNPVYVAWRGWIFHAVPQPSPDLAGMLSHGPAAADMYLGLGAPMSAVVAASPRRADVEVVYLSPVFDVVETLTAATGSRGSIPVDLAGALRRAGWSQDSPSPTPPPSSDALAQLRQMWQDTPR